MIVNQLTQGTPGVADANVFNQPHAPYSRTSMLSAQKKPRSNKQFQDRCDPRTKACLHVLIDMAEATKTTLVNETLPTSSGSSAASSVTKPIKGVSKPCFGCGCGDEDCECVCVVM
ncbi:hypothetical protein H101_05567 [Trichophyton interdigitale H6]|nr:hypothetical protein H101_05567 [Trichophyton interdigitale H6]